MDTIFNTDGCFYRALDDEPIFVLLARDPCFAETIRGWETSRQALIGRGEKPQGDHPMLLEALATATAGVAWRNESTDPTNGYDAGEHARWHVEKAPERELVLSGRNRGEPGGTVIAYDDWLTVLQTAMRLGNRFLLWTIDGDLVFNENMNWRDADKEPDWTGYYSVNNSLQRVMLWEALNDHKLAKQHKVDTIRALVKDSPETVKQTSGSGEIDPAKEALWIVMAEERGFLSAEDAEKARAALPEGTKAAITSKHMTFIVRDLAKKIATGLRQVTADMTEWVESKNPKFLTTGSGKRVGEYMDRINGYAAELEAGEADAARFRSRPIRMHPALGMPYEPQGDPYKRFASLIDYQEMTVEDARKIVEDFRKRFPDVLRVYEGLPPLDEIILDTLDRKSEIQDDLRRVMEEPQGRWTGGKINPSLYAKEVIEGIGKGFGKPYEEVAADYLHAAGVTEEAPLTAHIDFETRSSVPLKAESDTIDVTDVPEMPPHRFTIFTKARGWAYGRGLEINPAHIPDMLDRMEKDGWHLHAVFGGTVADKVGMLFKRVDPPADFNKAWEWLGSWCGKGLWVAGGLQPHRLEQLRKRIQGDDPVFPVRAMPPSVAEMMAAPTEGIDDADTDHGADDSWMGRGQEP